MATYFTSTTGNNSNPGSQSAPFLTINKGVSVLVPGDTLLIRGGTYAEWLNNTVPGGVSWSSPVTVAGYPGETAVLRPATNSSFAIYLIGSAKKYIVFDNLTIDGVNAFDGTIKLDRPTGQSAAHHIRFSNSTIKNSFRTAIVPVYSSDYNEFINLQMQSNGKFLDVAGVNTPGGLYHYAWYMRGSFNLIERCNVFDQGSSGIQIYANNAATEPPIGNIIRRCNFHDNSVLSSGQSTPKGAGIVLASGTGHEVYNNVIKNNRVGLLVSYVSGCKIFHNTVTANATIGVEFNVSPSNNQYKNNLVYGNGTNRTGTTATGLSVKNLEGVNPLFVAP